MVEGVVEELELRAEAINGGFDTVKSKAMQGRKKKRNREKLKKNDLMEMKLCYSSLQLFWYNPQYIYIYITITTPAECGTNITNPNPIIPDPDMCTQT